MIWLISLRDVSDYGFGEEANVRMRSRKSMEGKGTRAEAEAFVLAHYKATYPGRAYEVDSASFLDPEALPCPFCGRDDPNDLEVVGEKHRHVRCPCGAQGPTTVSFAATRDEDEAAAWAAWNARKA